MGVSHLATKVTYDALEHPQSRSMPALYALSPLHGPLERVPDAPLAVCDAICIQNGYTTVAAVTVGAMGHKVAIVMGSGSDRPVMEKAASMLDRFDIESDVRVLSAHKTPDQALEFATNAADSGFEVLIAGAGKAAHLAGVMAAKSLLPVIGVPISASLDGMDALLATVQMPTGIPVATVAIDGAANAALLAVAILAVSDEGLRDKLAQYRVDLAEKTLAG